MTPVSRSSSPLGISIQREFHDDTSATFKVAGISFILFKKPLDSKEDLSLNYPDSIIILLHPISAEKNIRINCIHLIALSQIRAKNGRCSIVSPGKIVSLAAKFEGNPVEISEANKQYFINVNLEMKHYIESRLTGSLEVGREDKFFDAIAQVVEIVSYPESLGKEYMLNSQIVEFYKDV